jgi:hypothetical protein
MHWRTMQWSISVIRFLFWSICSYMFVAVFWRLCSSGTVSPAYHVWLITMSDCILARVLVTSSAKGTIRVAMWLPLAVHHLHSYLRLISACSCASFQQSTAVHFLFKLCAMYCWHTLQVCPVIVMLLFIKLILLYLFFSCYKLVGWGTEWCDWYVLTFRHPVISRQNWNLPTESETIKLSICGTWTSSRERALSVTSLALKRNLKQHVSFRPTGGHSAKWTQLDSTPYYTNKIHVSFKVFIFIYLFLITLTNSLCTYIEKYFNLYSKIPPCNKCTCKKLIKIVKYNLINIWRWRGIRPKQIFFRQRTWEV